MNIDLQSTFELLQEQFAHIDTIQWIVLIFGVTEVLLARANNILLYPSGIIATTFSVYSLFYAQLYAECLLNFYYIIMSIYGWWYWVKKKNEPPVKISITSKQEWITVAAIVFGGWFILYFVLSRFTPSNVPAWDAWVSSTAWAGMWLLARRKIENWILLNISNAFAIPLLFQKELPLFGVLTTFLFIVACKGYIDWMRIHKREHEVNLSTTN
jgi:nicotinamide mononucleotide transporter